MSRVFKKRPNFNVNQMKMTFRALRTRTTAKYLGILRQKIGFIPLSTIETEQRLFAGAWRRNFVSLKEIRNLGHVMSRDDVSEVDFDKMSN